MRYTCVLALLLLGNVSAWAGDVADPRFEAMVGRIDELLLERMERSGVAPAARADDAEFLRRVYLDLAGRIPTVSQARDFLGDKDADKRRRLVDQLLNSPATVNHLAEVWRKAMLPVESAELLRNSAGLHAWLRGQFSNNMRYDRVVSDLIAATGSEQDGPALFFTALELEPKKLAAATARIFLGLHLECAECHDHPFDAWKQEDFWSYAAFFARLPRRDAMMASARFRLQDQATGEVTLPETERVVSPKYPGGERVSATALGTRRQQLSIWMASPENPYLARAAVNRFWAFVFGRGLVEPVDDLGPHNPASHPQLLEELTAYFVESGYDVKHLLRTLCATDAYHRTSQVDAAHKPEADLFAAMTVKVLTAEQLYDSLSGCLSQEEGQPSPSQVNAMNGRRQQFVVRMATRGVDAAQYDRGLQQALLLLNGAETAEATDLERSPLLTSLEAPFLDDTQRTDILFLATLTRPPTITETRRVSEFFGEAGSGAPQLDERRARADVLWALLNTAEFTVNH